MDDHPYESATEVSPTGHERARGVSIRVALVQIAIPLVLGAGIVVSVVPINALVFLFWLATVIGVARMRVARNPRSATAIFGIQTIVMTVVLVGAWMAPVKTKDRVLARSVSLPQTQMTLGQLKEQFESPSFGRFPVMLSFGAPAAEADQTLRWPPHRMTLRQFISIIEAQTPLRHRFLSCGNGWTILWGVDCCFGLSLNTPAGM